MAPGSAFPDHVVEASNSSASAGLTRSYLDHAATTPMLPEARNAMLAVLDLDYGNPSGSHAEARAARALLEEARDRVADVVGCRSREVVFTGGGTEAVNLAIAGVVGTLSGAGRSGGATDMHGATRAAPTVAWSAIEHDAARNCVLALDHAGRARSVELPVDRRGVVDIVALEALLLEELLRAESTPGAVRLGVVAVMAVNNEVGTIQPIGEVAALVRSLAPHAALVVDAVQALPWIDLRPAWGASDLLALSAHKFGGPKGVGCLVVREGRSIEPLLLGGGQERERRSGTQNVAGIVAMAEAAVVTDRRRADTVARVAVLRDRLVDGLVRAVAAVFETSPRDVKTAGNAHVCIDGVASEELLILLDRAGVAASAGSACASGALHVSPVLLAMGVAKDRALGSLRLTLGATTTAADVDLALAVIPAAVARLRS